MKKKTPKTYKVKVRRRYGKVAQRKGTTLQVVHKTEDLPEFYDGKKVGSKHEGRIIVQALRHEWGGRFIFQHPINGGRLRRGGQVLDFVFYSKPTLKVAFVNGDYWHTKNADELFRQREVKRVLGAGTIVEVVWDYEIMNLEDAGAWFADKIGYP